MDLDREPGTQSAGKFLGEIDLLCGSSSWTGPLSRVCDGFPGRCTSSSCATYDPAASEAVTVSPGLTANSSPTSAAGTAVSSSGCRVNGGKVVAFSPFSAATAASFTLGLDRSREVLGLFGDDFAPLLGLPGRHRLLLDLVERLDL